MSQNDPEIPFIPDLPSDTEEYPFNSETRNASFIIPSRVSDSEEDGEDPKEDVLSHMGESDSESDTPDDDILQLDSFEIPLTYDSSEEEQPNNEESPHIPEVKSDTFSSEGKESNNQETSFVIPEINSGSSSEEETKPIKIIPKKKSKKRRKPNLEKLVIPEIVSNDASHPEEEEGPTEPQSAPADSMARRWSTIRNNDFSLDLKPKKRKLRKKSPLNSINEDLDGDDPLNLSPSGAGSTGKSVPTYMENTMSHSITSSITQGERKQVSLDPLDKLDENGKPIVLKKNSKYKKTKSRYLQGDSEKTRKKKKSSEEIELEKIKEGQEIQLALTKKKNKTKFAKLKPRYLDIKVKEPIKKISGKPDVNVVKVGKKSKKYAKTKPRYLQEKKKVSALKETKDPEFFTKKSKWSKKAKPRYLSQSETVHSDKKERRNKVLRDRKKEEDKSVKDPTFFTKKSKWSKKAKPRYLQGYNATTSKSKKETQTTERPKTSVPKTNKRIKRKKRRKLKRSASDENLNANTFAAQQIDMQDEVVVNRRFKIVSVEEDEQTSVMTMSMPVKLKKSPKLTKFPSIGKVDSDEKKESRKKSKRLKKIKSDSTITLLKNRNNLLKSRNGRSKKTMDKTKKKKLTKKEKLEKKWKS